MRMDTIKVNKATSKDNKKDIKLHLNLRCFHLRQESSPDKNKVHMLHIKLQSLRILEFWEASTNNRTLNS